MIQLRYLFLLLVFSYCNTKKEEPIKPKDNPYMDAIRISATAEPPKDTRLQAKISFDTLSHHFGTIYEGDTVSYDFHFTNTGTTRLLINQVHSTCGCTFPSWPKGFISPGEKGIINILFDSHEKLGEQRKPITIVANTIPTETILEIYGYVQKRKK